MMLGIDNRWPTQETSPHKEQHEPIVQASHALKFLNEFGERHPSEQDLYANGALTAAQETLLSFAAETGRLPQNNNPQDRTRADSIFRVFRTAQAVQEQASRIQIRTPRYQK